MNNLSRFLYFFVGKSGSGKDSIMAGVRSKLEEEGIKTHILVRYITRPPHPSEPFESVSVEDFLKLKEQGKFALDWHIYGKFYGCPKELEDYLKKNYLVFVNVSRSILFKAKEQYPECKIILIEVNPEIAKQRIANRKRDIKDLEQREKRLKTKVSMPKPDLVVKNEGTLEEAILEVFNFIRDDVK
ncbi:MAG: hypothetical protein ACTSW1_16165 [Candidatus Hodarchaeales archaeon]